MNNPSSYFCVLLHLIGSTYKIRERNFQLFLPCSCLCLFMYKSDRNFEIVHMSFEEIDTKESASSLSEVSSLDDDIDRMHILHRKQSGHSTVSRKSCRIFIAWHAIREAEIGSGTKINRPNEEQAR